LIVNNWKVTIIKGLYVASIIKINQETNNESISPHSEVYNKQPTYGDKTPWQSVQTISRKKKEEGRSWLQWGLLCGWKCISRYSRQ